MTQKVKTNSKWNYENLHDLLIACVGLNFGDKPEDNIDKIREYRGYAGNRIRKILEINKNHTVVDIGSGCGFVTRSIVPYSNHVYCVDISADFLDYCRSELSEFTNVSYIQSNYASFPGIEDTSVDIVYSTAVFIHFNFYDMVHYLQEINRILNNGGLLLFDFLNSDRISLENQITLRQHLSGYKSNRESKIFNVVHPFSMRTLENIVPQSGYSIRDVYYVQGNANTTVVLKKNKDWQI